MLEQIIEYLQLPKETIIRKRVPKTQFIRKGDFTKADEKIINNDVELIKILANLNTNNTNIATLINEDIYYDSIFYLYVKLKNRRHIKELSSIIQDGIPSATVIIYDHDGHLSLNTAQKRINKNNHQLRVIEEMYDSIWFQFNQNDVIDKFINDIALPQLNLTNFYETILDIGNKLSLSLFIDLIDFYPLDKQFIHIKNEYECIQQLTRNKKNLLVKRKEETNFGRQMDYNVKIKKIDKEISKLERIIRGE